MHWRRALKKWGEDEGTVLAIAISNSESGIARLHRRNGQEVRHAIAHGLGVDTDLKKSQCVMVLPRRTRGCALFLRRLGRRGRARGAPCLAGAQPQHGEMRSACDPRAECTKLLSSLYGRTCIPQRRRSPSAATVPAARQRSPPRSKPAWSGLGSGWTGWASQRRPPKTPPPSRVVQPSGV